MLAASSREASEMIGEEGTASYVLKLFRNSKYCRGLRRFVRLKGLDDGCVEQTRPCRT